MSEMVLDDQRQTELAQGDHLKSFVESLQALEEQKAEIMNTIKEKFAEVKGAGYDVKAVRKLLALLKRDKAERDEEAAMIDLYLQAVGETA